MAEEKKGMFGAAKAKPAAKSKKDDKETVFVLGLEQKLKDLQEFKAQIADLEALVSGISDELKVLGKEKFIELYLRDKTNPNTFLIKDGEGCIMFLPMDKYIGVKDEERADKLKAEYGDVITKDERYYFNGTVLERNQDTIEKLLMGSPDITDADKENLLVKEVKFSIKKGTIDGLLKYGDKISTVVDDIQPIFQIKNCGGTLADGGSIFTEEEDIIYDTRADDYYYKNKNADLEAAIAKWEAEEADKYMAGGGKVDKLLIIYRLVDSKTLAVTMYPDKTLGYSYYGGWQDRGTPFSISNMQLRKSLPMGSRNFKTVEQLHEEIVSVLKTGFGSKISSYEILNDEFAGGGSVIRAPRYAKGGGDMSSGDFLGIWHGDSYGENSSEILNESSFTEDNGYSPDDIKAIKKLKRGELYESIDGNGSHWVFKYAGGGSVIRANNSPTLRYANFEDNWHINLLELNPYRNNQSGLRYKGGNKYAVTRVSPKSGQEVFEFKTLEDAENKFNKLVELGKTFSPIRNEGKTPRYAKGGGLEAVIYEVYIDRGNSGTETIADFENKKDAVNFIYEYNLKHPKAKLGIDTLTSDYNIDSVLAEYKEHIDKDYKDSIAYFKNDKSMLEMFKKDKADHYSVMEYMKLGLWSGAYKEWAGMDTASREKITNVAYELLMKKNGYSTYKKGGGSVNGLNSFQSLAKKYNG